MSDLIDRESAIVQACKQIKDDYVAHDVKEALKVVPSAQPERKKGKWICWYEEIENDTCFEYIWKLPHCKCSECGTEYDWHTVKFINFCSYCGADMRGEEHDL